MQHLERSFTHPLRIGNFARAALLTVLVFATSNLAPCTGATVPLGINGAVQFVNLTNDGGFYAVSGGTYTEDSNGWPSSDFTCNFFDERRNMPWSGPDPDGSNADISGDYKVSFTGQAVILDNSGYGTTFTVQNQNYNAGSNITTCDIVVNPDKWFVEAQFTSTQRTSGSGTNTGLTNVRVIRAGYNANTSQTYTNECLDSYGPGFTTIRTMDLSDTNSYPIWQGTNLFPVNFSDRPKVADAYQGGTLTENVAGHAGLGVAWEYLVQLCNEVNANIWINVPINATDAYATNLANLLKYGSDGVNPYTSTQSSPVWAPLNSNLHVYLEYSNEVWNFSFKQAVYNENKADTDGLSYANEYAKRSYQLVQDFQIVYGTTNTTLRPVLCWQEGTELSFQPTLDWLISTYGITIANVFYGIGQAPYYNYTDGTTVNSILATDWTGGDSLRPTYTQWEQVARTYGVKVIGYESGPGYGTGVGMTAFRSPAVAAQIQEYYDTDFFAVGGDTVNYFAGGFSGAGPCGGTWTQGEDWSNQSSPKNLGMIATLSSPAPALNAGALLPWLSTQTTSIDPSDTDTKAPSGATSENWYIGTSGQSEFYLLRSATSANYNLWLNGSCNQSGGMSVEVLVDDTDIGTFAVTETDANSSTFTTGTLAAGLHSLRLIGSPTGNVFLDSINLTLNSGGGTSSAPTAPDWPVVHAQASGSVTLYWYSSSLATSYNVGRSTSYSGPYTTIASPTATAQPSYTDAAAANNTTYYYAIQAVNAIGTSPVSSTISATPVAGIAGVPTSLSITSNATSTNICGNGGGLVTLTWPIVTGATAYNLMSGSSTSSLTNAGTMQATTYFKSALTAGQTYYYELASVNASGTSAYSSAVSATPTGAIPAAPTGLTATATQMGVALAWTPPANMDPQYSPDQYFVYRSTTSGSGYAEVYSTSVDNTVDRTAVANGTTYYYVVTANNATGDSAYSNQASAAPTAAGAIDIAAGGSAVSGSNWAADTDYSGGSTNSTATYIDTSLIGDPAPIKVYQGTRTAPSGSNLVYTITGLVDNAPYKLRLHFAEIVSGTTQGQRVFNVLVNGSQVLSNYDVVGRTGSVDKAVVEKLNTVASSSGTLTVTFVSVTGLAMVNGIEVGYTGTGAAALPAAPTSLTAAASNGQVALTWTGSAYGTSYDVYRGTATGGESTTPIATGVTTTGYTNTGLTDGTTYYYVAAAVNSAGTGSNSNEANGVPSSGGAPSPPTNLAANPGNAQIALSWTGSSGATSYNVYRGTAAGGESTTAIATGITLVSYTNTGLTNGVTYYYKVAALNSSGTSGYSNEADAEPVGPPAAPTTLLVNGEIAQVCMSWSASPGATSYNIQRSTVSGSGYASIATGVTATNYINSGLTNGTTYFYEVEGVSPMGTSPFSTQTGAAPSSSLTITLNPTDDRDKQSDNSAGTNTIISASEYDTAAFKFNMTGITGTVSSATLELYRSDVNQGSVTFELYQTANDTWLQTGAVPPSSTEITTVVNDAIGYVDINVLSYVTSQLSGDSIASFDVLTNNGGYSNIHTRENATDLPLLVITLTSSVPSAPTSLGATPGNLQAALSWTGSSGATSYDVYRGTTAGGEATTPIATGITTTSDTDTGLTSGATYYYKVTAVNSAGTSGYSNEASVVPTGISPAPTGLSAAAGNTNNTLSWTASSGATSYNVYRGTAAGGEATTPITTGITTTSDTDTGLTNGQTYYYTVAAVNPSGTSGYSNEVNAMPNGNTHTGSWSLQLVSANPATWHDMNQVPNCTASTLYTASFWMKGTGGVTLRIDTSAWGLIVGNTYDATSSWTQHSFTANSGTNTSLMFLFTDGSGVAGTCYMDDCFLGTGTTNLLANPGFESGDTIWWVPTGGPFTVVQNP